MNPTLVILALSLGQAVPPLAASPPGSPGLPVLPLAEALAEADTNNFDLKVARAKLTAARELSSKAWSGYLPQISAGASYTRNGNETKFMLPSGYWIRELQVPGGPQVDPTQVNGPVQDPSRPVTVPPDVSNPPGMPSTHVLYPSEFQELTIQKQDQLGGQLQLQQALVVPALWPAIQNAYLAADYAELNVENARQEVLFGVAQLYYGCAGLKQAVEVQKKMLETHQARERDADVRFRAGTAPRILLVRAQIDRARGEQDVRRAENSYTGAKIALATLLGRTKADFEIEPPPAPALDANPTALSETAAQRSDVQAAHKGLELAERVRSATWYKYAPNLGLTATWRLANVKGFSEDYDSWAVMLGLSWTLWDGGLRESELRENAAKVAEAEAALASAQLKARHDVERALLDVESAGASLQKADEQLKLARENMQLVNVNYANGVATPVELSDATTSLAAAELGLVAEKLNAQLAVLKLSKAAGLFGTGSKGAPR